MKPSFDFLIIGGGSGGIAAAVEAAKLAQKVCLIEQNLIGGTCVNNGCIPKKITWLASNVYHTLNNADAYGIKTTDPELSWNKLYIIRKSHIQNIQKYYKSKFAELGVTTIKGRASFIDSNSILVNKKTYSARHIIIATGSSPKFPDIPGKEFCQSSDDFFKLKSQPQDITIVGGGYIGVELACTLNRLGSKVTLVLRGKSILSGFDSEVAAILQENMQKDGISILQDTEISQIKKSASKLCLSLKNSSKTIKTDNIIYAIGRRANTHNLNLNDIGVKIDEKGFIVIDKHQATTAKGIYAVGDVTNRPALTPVAIRAGRHLVQYLLNKDKIIFSYENIPSVIFSHPPYGSVGISENKAKKAGHDICVYQKKFVTMQDKLEKRKNDSIVKIITSSKTGVIIGCHILGPGADEILQGFALAVVMKLTMEDLSKCLAIHPTFAEELVLLTP